ncbi:serine hydrolase domain-containing protein [Kutzneria buriramensis]|uniref:CubicO group peptidase (Beta-lactamase class C family) n=1 Tax=Kutzneria buriramensis TaxID=1045776 RepID=A0A3E0HUR6_9PSEU|nr:serine hydrolase domain-containing protein [Kutzneria buriramensis]REH50178.1 CubicO group peptidase (beta-lactamase class C family) [Kutzneria buriramensis]
MRIRALALPAVLVLAFAVTSAAGGAPNAARFDRPYQGFAPANTVLRAGSPAAAGLNPAPIDAFDKQLAAWVPSIYPGATVLLAHNGVVVDRTATGEAVKYKDATTLLPADQQVPARTDTIYDLASLSKLFTSIVAVQQLEAGKIALDTPVAHYLPEFATNGKGGITIEQLLTHTSGLAPDPVPSLWQGYPDIPSREKAILDAAPQEPAGTAYVYSDLNMLSMQLVLQHVTGKPLDQLVREDVTEPLHMVDTGYNPPASKLGRIAATEYQTSPPRGMVRGSVHDENAWAMGGVAGHAGVFSTVDDLAVLSQAILNGGVYRGHRVLSEHGVQLMEQNFNQKFPDDSHGLGFELDQIWYMGGLSGPNTLGHTGFTGTSLVIDPGSRSFAILLTNRVHPTRNTPSTNGARRAAAEALAQAMTVSAPGGGQSWFSGQGPASTSTLTTGVLHGPENVSFEAFVNTESTDLLTLESSVDGGATWTTVPLTVRGQSAPQTALSGQSVRAWRQVRAHVAGSSNGLLLRWRYTTDPAYEGRGVNVADIRLSTGRTTFTPAGWQLV